IGGKSSIFHPKNPKIEGIFHGCLRFLDSKGTNGSAPCTLSILFDKKRQLKKKIKTGEKVIEKITFSPIDLIANNTS
ncbi:hypothetical protein ACTQZM_09640, partial [Enterococcus cecorum]|uniref:hypothetical protein n=1 Tax=Enterococcus cecorum TaxID=44008 RepID=UPI003F8E77F6